MLFRHERSRLARQRERDVSTLQEQIGHLETELATKESELVQERQIKEDLFQQASAVAQNQDSERKFVYSILKFCSSYCFLFCRKSKG